MLSSTRVRILTRTIAIAATTAVFLPGVASAENAVDPAAPASPIAGATLAPSGLTPAGDAATGLAAAVDPLATPAASSADTAAPAGIAEKILQSGLISADTPANVLTTYQGAVEALQKLGINPFLYPTGAANCSGATGLPFEIAPAAAGAMPGPWPNLPVIPGLNFNGAGPGEVMYAFVPAGIGPDTGDTRGMQLAWFNINTFQGGIEEMGTVGQIAARAVPDGLPPVAGDLAKSAVENFLKAAIPFGGVRAVPVETGNGTVLAAIFGTVRNGEKSCFFLPTVSVTNVG